MGWEREVGSPPALRPKTKPRGAGFWIMIAVGVAVVSIGIRYAVTGDFGGSSSGVDRDALIDEMNRGMASQGVEVEADGDRLVVVRGTCNLFTLISLAGNDSAKATLKDLGFGYIACGDGAQLPIR